MQLISPRLISSRRVRRWLCSRSGSIVDDNDVFAFDEQERSSWSLDKLQEIVLSEAQSPKDREGQVSLYEWNGASIVKPERWMLEIRNDSELVMGPYRATEDGADEQARLRSKADMMRNPVGSGGVLAVTSFTLDVPSLPLGFRPALQFTESLLAGVPHQLRHCAHPHISARDVYLFQRSVHYGASTAVFDPCTKTLWTAMFMFPETLPHDSVDISLGVYALLTSRFLARPAGTVDQA
ncbi:hypothetical protein DIPPA_56073 [Diplonema papillatum]|nr:hypothetical protein DIPPA_56073 [Diplonema papillatum]